MSIKGKYPESTPLYVALLSAGAVAAIAVFAIVLSLNPIPAEEKEERPVQQTSASTTAEPEGFEADEAVAEEMKDAAQLLVSNNYEILSLYYIHGTEHKDEPYGNAPEDGYYTAICDYSSIEELEALVDATFLPEQAVTVKANSLGYGPIYKTRDNGELGIIENFTPMPYEKSWENPQFSIEPLSDTDCIIHITLHDRNSGEDIPLSGEMTKTEEGWRLKTILF